MNIALVIIFVGVLLFAAQALSRLFDRTGVPDVLLLLGLGLLLGPGLGLVSQESFGAVGPVFTTVVLVAILFESGLGTDIDALTHSMLPALLLTIASFAASLVVSAAFGMSFLGLTLGEGLLLGAILGGTSSAVVIPMVAKMTLGERTSTTLVLESTVSDVLCIVGTLALVQALTADSVSVAPVVGQILLSFLVPVLIGAVGGTIWSAVLNRVRQLEHNLSLTIAAVFVVFGLSEALEVSGAIAALSFGVLLGNVQVITKPLKRFVHLEPVHLNLVERGFYAELAFVIKTFFFVYVGVMMTLDNLPFFLLGLAFTVLIFAMRIPVVRLALRKGLSKRDATVSSFMVPKGLAAAVLASVPLQFGVAGGEVIRSTTFAVVVSSITICAVLAFLNRLGMLDSVYGIFFRSYPDQVRSAPARSQTGIAVLDPTTLAPTAVAGRSDPAVEAAETAFAEAVDADAPAPDTASEEASEPAAEGVANRTAEARVSAAAVPAVEPDGDASETAVPPLDVIDEGAAVLELPADRAGPALDPELDKLRAMVRDAAEQLEARLLRPRQREAHLIASELQQVVFTALDGLRRHVESVSDPDAQRHWIRQSRLSLAEHAMSLLLAERERLSKHDLAPDAIQGLFAALEATKTRVPTVVSVEVPRESDLYARRASDGRWRRLRKALSRARQRTFLRQTRRYVSLARLTELLLVVPAPTRLVGFVNLVGQQPWSLWNRLGKALQFVDGRLCAMLDQLDDPMVKAPSPPEPLAGIGGSASSDERVASQPIAAQRREEVISGALIAERVRELAQDARVEFAAIAHAIDASTASIRVRLHQVLAGNFQALLDATQVAGTWQLRPRSLGADRRYQEADQALAEIEVALSRWHVLSLGESGRVLIALDVIDLQHAVAVRVSEAEIELANALLNDLRPVVANVAEHTRTALASLSQGLSSGDMLPASMLAMLEGLREKLGENIAAPAIGQLETQRDRGRFNDLVEPFVQHLADDCARLTQVFDVAVVETVDAIEPGVTPPEPRLETFQLRELARALLGGDIAIRLNEINLIVARTVNLTISTMSDAVRVATFNLDAAVGELASDHEEARELARDFAIGGLTRSLARLDDVARYVRRVDRHVAQVLRFETAQQLNHFLEIVRACDVDAVGALLVQRAADREHEATQRLRGPVSRIAGRVADAFENRIAPRARALSERVRTQLGVDDEARAASIADLTEAATFAATENAAVPTTYRRLFATSPVENDEFFVGRRAEFERFEAVQRRFVSGKRASLLVLGEGGVGKTSFIDYCLRTAPTDLPLARANFTHNLSTEQELAVQLGELLLGQRTPTLDRLRARLRNSRKQRIAVIEGLQNFYLRTLDGLGALRRFLVLVSETSHVVLWIVSCDRDAHAWFQNLVPVELFTDTLELQPFDHDDLRRVIETRHNVSGFRLSFLSETSSVAPRTLSAGAAEQRAWMFFDALARHSHGNVRLALFYWLRALVGLNDDQSAVEVRPIEPLETRFLDGMRTNRLIAMALLISHGGLTLERFARVFRVPQDDALALLTELTQQNLLYLEAGRVSTYHVNPVLHRDIAVTLRERNLL